MRRKYVIGNWKMYKTSREAIDYIEHLAPLVEDCDVNKNLYFPDADMTKETKYEFVENVSKITNTDEDSVWEVYDDVYNRFYEL